MGKPESSRERVKRKNRNPKIQSAIAALVVTALPPLRVLDLGVRDGYSTKELTKAGYTVIGTDSDREFVKYAQGRGLPVIYDDVMQTRLRSHSFDVIYGRHVLEHCAPTELFFEQCAKLLKPSGIVFFIFPLEPVRKPGNHKVFFPSLDDFPGSGRFEQLVLCNSSDVGIIPFSEEKGEALYVGKLK